MFDIITIGDLVVDTHVKIDDAKVTSDFKKNRRLCLSFADKIPITESFQSLGGNAGNVAVASVKLGEKTAVVSTVGMDSNSVLIKQELKKQGVVTDYLVMDSMTATRYSIVLTHLGERTILSYHKKRNYTFPQKLPLTKCLYYTSLSEGFKPLQKKLFAYLVKHPDTLLAFNPGSYQIKNAVIEVKQAIKKTDLLIVNLEEAMRILWPNKKDIGVRENVAGVMNGLWKLGAKEVVLTDGENGAYAGNKKEVWQMKIYPEKVVSKTGAGDAFSAGFIAGKIKGYDIPTCLMWGAANSAGVVRLVGAQNGLLSESGIKKMIVKYKNIKPKRVKK
jgi:ribokinase